MMNIYVMTITFSILVNWLYGMAYRRAYLVRITAGR